MTYDIHKYRIAADLYWWSTAATDAKSKASNQLQRMIF